MLGALSISGVNLAKQIVGSTPLSPFLKKIYYRYKTAVGERHPIQNTKTSGDYSLERLGTEYGGWVFVDEEELYNSPIISAGLGEDASFDIEFAEKYNSEVTIVDPTPRAIQHFKEIKESLGRKKTKSYTQNGKEPVAAYDLSNINNTQLTLIEKALWNELNLNFISQKSSPTFPIQSSTGNTTTVMIQTILRFQRIQSRRLSTIKVLIRVIYI